MTNVCKCVCILCSGDVEAVAFFHSALLDSLHGEMLMCVMVQVNKINTNIHTKCHTTFTVCVMSLLNVTNVHKFHTKSCNT